jgi:hypothetical protein
MMVIGCMIVPFCITLVIYVLPFLRLDVLCVVDSHR